ncbi:hypothetical protein WA1_48715 [Scytonema hofmannii PCC 7110]|uniref:Glucose-methanol-choline oxidoreductase C-terminal domain-containing protein n=1 Tax=Scytonema hofmannii PCC 7110 TaxID=128403 RepID=A0A139WTZ7_9CYAN|nr:hypothetical protein WA1_48715 [Scytonema hofmannii PCC 7110]
MLIDARTLPTGETIETEICIVSAGPAGNTLAREFTSADFRVCLLESGGLEFDPNTHRDRLGRQKVKLHWCGNDIDIHTIKRSQDILKEEIARSGIGQLEIDRDGNQPELIHPGTHHHMGTTRMHDDPTQGVVDRNCQVHGISNLFIAGSSVFPTGGYANPTLSIVALAIRLADHLKKLMTSQAV